jgi:hypothetical protein
MRVDVGPDRLRLPYRSCKGHLSIRQIRTNAVGSERVGEGTALGHRRSSTGIGFLVAVIRVMGRCRAMGSRASLAEMEEWNCFSRDLVDSIEALSI